VVKNRPYWKIKKRSLQNFQVEIDLNENAAENINQTMIINSINIERLDNNPRKITQQTLREFCLT